MEKFRKKQKLKTKWMHIENRMSKPKQICETFYVALKFI